MISPLVSVITPCKNPGDLLITCLESIRAQDYSPVEHVVIDGGSTDGTVELLSQEKGTLWISEQDSGQADAINKGFHLSRGEFVGWLNADDSLSEDALSKAVKAMQLANAGWAYGEVKVVEGGKTRIWKPPADPKSHLFEMGKGGVIPQPGSLIRREAWDSVGDLDSAFHLAMDFDFWLRLIDAAIPHVYVPHVLATFHIHPVSKTGELGLGPFFVEEARAFLKSGRTHHASIALGRAAAQTWCSSGSKVGELRNHLELALEAFGSSAKLDLWVVQAAARTEGALVDRSAWKLLLHPSPWRVSETRRRIVGGLLKFGGSRLKGTE